MRGEIKTLEGKKSVGASVVWEVLVVGKAGDVGRLGGSSSSGITD